MSKSIEQIRRTDIRTDKTQSRAKIDPDTLHDYADLIRDEVQLPPLVVFYDGEFYWLADGFHRCFAHQNIGSEFVNCEVRDGTLRDALKYSLGANVEHGLRRTNDDKQRAVEIALSDDEWGGWSDRAIAQLCGVSPTTVGTIRATFQVSKVNTSSKRAAKTRVGSDGKQYPAKSPNPNGRPPKPVDFNPPPMPEPDPEPETPARKWGEGNSLEDVQADLEELRRRCLDLSKFARSVLRCEGDEITRPYCGNYSLVTVSHPILHVGRVVKNDMPVGGTPKKPILFHEEKAKSIG